MPMFQLRDHCDVCGSGDGVLLIKKPLRDPAISAFLVSYYEGHVPQEVLDKGVYEVRRCAHCGFAWQAHIFSDEWMRQLYGQWISSEKSLRKRRGAGIVSFERRARQIARIAHCFERRPSAVSVLDFGMGWGHWCLMARAFGYQVTGFEVAGERVAHARANGIEVIDSEAALSERRFDFIVANQVFEHLPRPRETMSLLAGCLRAQGILHVAVPNGRRALRTLRDPSWVAGKGALQPLEHINCFTSQALDRLGQIVGLFSHRMMPHQRPSAALNCYLKLGVKMLFPSRWGINRYLVKPK